MTHNGEDANITLVQTSAGLALTDGTMRLVPDFSSMIERLAPHRLSGELLVRAARVKGATGTPTLLDATAGLGEDSLLLAASGFEVTLYESNPVIAALLDDAVNRARETPGLEDAASRMHVIEGDSVAAMRALASGAGVGPFDVVYLDPMFPDRRKSAAVKKKFQLLHHLERPADNEGDLLSAARALHPKKIVIKRPLKGPYLCDTKPSYSLRGKTVRYDVLVGV